MKVVIKKISLKNFLESMLILLKVLIKVLSRLLKLNYLYLICWIIIVEIMMLLCVLFALFKAIMFAKVCFRHLRISMWGINLNFIILCKKILKYKIFMTQKMVIRWLVLWFLLLKGKEIKLPNFHICNSLVWKIWKFFLMILLEEVALLKICMTLFREIFFRVKNNICDKLRI